MSTNNTVAGSVYGGVVVQAESLHAEALHISTQGLHHGPKDLDLHLCRSYLRGGERFYQSWTPVRHAESVDPLVIVSATNPLPSPVWIRSVKIELEPPKRGGIRVIVPHLDRDAPVHLGRKQFCSWRFSAEALELAGGWTTEVEEPFVLWGVITLESGVVIRGETKAYQRSKEADFIPLRLPCALRSPC